MSDDILLSVNHIDAHYDSLQVLWDISIDVKRGEAVAIIGANGSGKSTLLNTIAGVLHPTNGTVSLLGQNISGWQPYEIVTLGMSLVPEGRRVFPEMTVAENLRLGSYNAIARKNRDKNFETVYRHFPRLKDRKSQLAKTLSGGEMQMMAIGSALMSNPSLLLLDEMSLGLSPMFVNELFEVLKEIRANGITVLFVEQNVRKTLHEADRAYILESGRVVLSGAVEELREEDKIQKAYFGA